MKRESARSTAFLASYRPVRTTVVLILSLAGGAVGVVAPGPAWAAPTPPESNPKVYVEALRLKDVFATARYVGRIEPRHVARLYSPIEGVVTGLYVRAGQQVKKNQLLAKLTRNEIGLRLNPLEVRSPIDGILFVPEITERSLVGRNAPLFAVYSPDEYLGVMHVTPDDARHLLPGGTVRVALSEAGAPGSISSAGDISGNSPVVTATVHSVSPDFDPETGTRRAEILIRPLQGVSVRPGMLADVEFTYGHRKGFLVDRRLVQKRGKQRYLRLVSPSGEVRELNVETGLQAGPEIELVSAELKDGDRVIVKSSAEPLMPGQKVSVVEPEKAGGKRDAAESQNSGAEPATAAPPVTGSVYGPPAPDSAAAAEPSGDSQVSGTSIEEMPGA